MSEWLAHRALELLREYRQIELALMRARMLQDYAHERESLRRRRWQLQEQIDRFLRDYPEGDTNAGS